MNKLSFFALLRSATCAVLHVLHVLLCLLHSMLACSFRSMSMLELLCNL